MSLIRGCRRRRWEGELDREGRNRRRRRDDEVPPRGEPAHPVPERGAQPLAAATSPTRAGGSSRRVAPSSGECGRESESRRVEHDRQRLTGDTMRKLSVNVPPDVATYSAERRSLVTTNLTKPYVGLAPPPIQRAKYPASGSRVLISWNDCPNAPAMTRTGPAPFV